MRVPSRAVLIAVAAVVVLAAGALVAFRGRSPDVQYSTFTVDRGDIVDVVGATGTLQAVTTVQVGSQVSGTIASLDADFNSHVRKDEVVARLDPSIFDARLSQARANLVAAHANVERARATVADTKQKYERAKELAAQSLLPASDLETAKSNYEVATANVRAAEAEVAQSSASVQQAQVDLGHTVIKAPIDGVVVARNVDVGQTVAASLQAPTLFIIANDLSHMQVNASIDEADIGRVRMGQDVTFHVDAYPSETFTGRVEQVRLQPITSQNVVTYNTIIAVENTNQRLMPGMTATVSLIVQKREAALRIPASALRFRPEGWEARTGRRGAFGAASGAPSAGAASGGPAAGPSPAASVAAPGEGGRGRRRASAAGGGAPGERPAPGAGTGGGERSGTRPTLVFVLGPNGSAQPRPVHTGISDGQYVEVVDGLEEGAPVITGAGGETPRAGAPRTGASGGNPFAPQPPQRRQR